MSVSNDTQKKVDIINSLKEKLKEVDVLADEAIKKISKEAEAAKLSTDPSTVKNIDVSRLEEIIRRADAIIYSPEIMGVLSENPSVLKDAASINMMIETIRNRIRVEIEKELIGKYSDVEVGITGRDLEGTPTTYSDNVAPSTRGTFGGFFSEFVEKNIDDSRVNYEARQLALMKAAPIYSKVCDEKEANGEDYTGGIGKNIDDLTYVNENKKISDTLFDKMKEYTPDRIAEIKENLTNSNVTSELIQKAYDLVLWYGEECRIATKEVKDDPSAYESRKSVIEKILYGKPEAEKDFPVELEEVVRYLSIQYAYALSMSSSDKDKSMKEALLACYKSNTSDSIDALKKIIDQGAAVIEKEANLGQAITRQKNRAYIESVKSIPNISETLFVVFPELEKVIQQLEGQDGFDGAGDALYSYLESFVKRYNNHEFDMDISELENYVISYRKAVEEAATAPAGSSTPKTGDEIYAKQVNAQESIVQRHKDLLKRKNKYQEINKVLGNSGVKESESKLDLIHLSKPSGIQLTKNLDIAGVSKYSSLSAEKKKQVVDEVINGISPADYERLRFAALEYYENNDEKALVEQGGFFHRAWAFIKNTVRNIFGLRNIKTKREQTLNGYIVKNYIEPMLEKNEEIQKQYDFVKSEREGIKDEDIELKNIASEKARKKRENEDSRKDKYKNLPKARKEDRDADGSR